MPESTRFQTVKTEDLLAIKQYLKEGTYGLAKSRISIILDGPVPSFQPADDDHRWLDTQGSALASMDAITYSTSPKLRIGGPVKSNGWRKLYDFALSENELLQLIIQASKSLDLIHREREYKANVG